MNDATIYDKTAEGEEAIREKTRLVQRNLRLVLVLVNGSADVGSLKRSLGDAAMVEAALIELERLCLIESEEACAARLAANEPEPGLVERPLTDTETVFDEEMATKIRVAPGYVPSVEEPDKAAKASPLAAIPNWIEGLRSSRARAQEEAIYERAYGSEGIEHEFEDPVSIIPVDPPSLSSSRSRISVRSWLKIGFVTALAVIVAGVILFPYDSYRLDFEQRLALIVDDVVKVGALKVAFLPYPTITLERVSVGTPPYVAADQIRLVPDAGFLLSGQRFRQAELSGVRVREDALRHLSHWFLPASMGDSSVRELIFDRLSVEIDGTVFDGLSGKAAPDVEGLGRITLHASDKLELEILAATRGLSLGATAKAWQPSFQPLLTFTRLDVRGELIPGRFLITSIDALLYDGQVVGKGSVEWGKNASADLALEFQHLAAGKLLVGLAAETAVEGEASGRLRILAQAPSLNALDRNARTEGSFKVVRGGIKHLDLIEAIRTKAVSPVQGGTTRFEEFSGTLTTDSGALRLGNLRLASGLLRGSGQATVSRPSGDLSGMVSLEMRSSTESARATVALSGSAGSPILKSGR